MLREIDIKRAIVVGLVGVVIVLCPFIQFNLWQTFGGMLIGICIAVLCIERLE